MKNSFRIFFQLLIIPTNEVNRKTNPQTENKKCFNDFNTIFFR